MPVVIPLYLVSHTRKVANLYKKCLRLSEGINFNVDEKRYNAALIRRDFDEILNEKDMRKSKLMLLNYQMKMKEKYITEPIYFPDSPNGGAYERELIHPDLLLDLWHPLEKAKYPEYFAKREIRKQQYIEMWDKIHGPPPPHNYENIDEDHDYI